MEDSVDENTPEETSNDFLLARELAAEPGSAREAEVEAPAPSSADAHALEDPALATFAERRSRFESPAEVTPDGAAPVEIAAEEQVGGIVEQYPPDVAAQFSSREASGTGTEVEANGAPECALNSAVTRESDADSEQCFDAGREEDLGHSAACAEPSPSSRSRRSVSQPAPIVLPIAARFRHSSAAGLRQSRVEEAITALQRDVNKQLRAIEDRITYVEKKQRHLFNECGFPPREQSSRQPVRAVWRPAGTSVETYARGHRTSGGGGAWRSPAARRPSRSPSQRRRSGTSPSPGARAMSPTAHLRRNGRRAGKQRRGGSVPLVDHWRLDSPSHSLELRSSSGTTETLFVLEDELQSIKDFLRHSKGHMLQGLYA